MMNHQNDKVPCDQPGKVATEYCRKLKSGMARLKAALQKQYAAAFPDRLDSIERAVAEAEASSWATPFPALFFPALARIRIDEIAAKASTDLPFSYQP